MMSVKGALGFAFIMLSASSAMAGEWRYCLAPSQAEHKIYMTAPFSVNAGADDSEARFDDALGGMHLRHDDVQCPHSNDEASAVADKQYAVEFNRKSGNQVVNLRWPPDR
jgi:hypothetical protein